MELHNLHRAGQLIGAGLSTEEISGLEVATLQRKTEENLIGKVSFWGKIYGSKSDYLIVYNINPTLDFPDKKYYYCTTSDYTLKAFPPLKEEYVTQASKLTSAFLGEPSFFAYNGEDPDAVDDPDAPPVEKFREVHRLLYTVQKNRP